MNLKALIILAFSFLSISLAFTNCGGQAFEISKDVQDSASVLGLGCEDILQFQYAKNIQPFFSSTSRCLNCHVAGGPGRGQFASPDPTVSLFYARSMGVPTLLAQSKNPNHKPPYTGSHNTAAADSLLATWTKISSDYNSCLAADTKSEFLVSQSFETPVPTVDTTVEVVEIDLSEAQIRPIDMIVRFNISRFKVNGEYKGYLISDPAAKVKSSGKSYQLDSIYFTVNGVRQDETTTYSSIKISVNSTNYTKLTDSSQSGSAAIFGEPDSKDQIGVIIANKRPVPDDPNPYPTGLPAPVNGGGGGSAAVSSYNDLMAPNGIFRTQCLSCHNGPQGAGRFDISNYFAASQKATSIKSRVQNRNSPMPTGGLMAPAMIKEVVDWVDAGAPQN